MATLGAFAQLSGSLSNGLSGSLDQNLNGLDSSVSPIPSTEIVPGANNLMNVDAHSLPFDAVGGSVLATTMNPSTTTSIVVGNVQSQVDGLLRDSPHLTSGSPLVALSRLSATGLASKSTSFTVSSLPSLPLAKSSTASAFSISAKENKEKGQGLSLPTGNNSNVGFDPTGTAGTIGPTTGTDATVSDDKSDRSSDTDKTSTIKKRRPGTIQTAKKKDFVNQDSPELQPEDFSRSPLERALDTADQEQTSSKNTGPFRNLNTSSFLNPDIFSSSSRSGQATSSRQQFSNQQKLYGMRNLNSSQLRAAIRKQKQAGDVQGTSSQLGVIRLRSDRSERRLHKQKRPKWHNPILQQMESADSRD